MYFHVNGELVPAESASVGVQDRGFMYGDAAFETLRAYGGDIFEWDAHAERLARTCDTLGLAHGLSEETLRARVAETLAANDLSDAYVRLSITRGQQPGTLDPQPEIEPTVVVIVKDLPRGGRDGSAVWDAPATAEIVETRRIPDDALPAAAKTHNYLNGILARLELEATDEAIMLDEDGNLAEGTTSNLFFVTDGTLHTPALSGPVLPGITRSVVLELARAADIPVEEGRYDPEALHTAEEAFLTNTTWEVRPVDSVDGVSFDGREITDRLARRFDALVDTRYY